MCVNASICLECKNPGQIRFFWLSMVSDAELQKIVDALYVVYDKIIVCYL